MAEGSSSRLHLDKVLQILEQMKISSARVLDYGAGNGTLLSALSTKGFRGYGLDALSKPVSLSLKIDWKVANLNDQLPTDLVSAFDCVTAIETIEHLENPRHCLRSLFSALKPGGTMIVSSPNVLSLRSLISLFFRGHFVDFLDSSYPAHITPVLPIDALRMAKELGAEEISLSFSNRGVLPVLTSLTWQSLSWNFLKGPRFSDHWFLVARKPSR